MTPTVNGVFLEVPYAIITNISNARTWTLSVLGTDPRAQAYDQNQLRVFKSASCAPGTNRAPISIPVYVGDVITFHLQAPANTTGANVYDLNSVNSSGVQAKFGSVGFNAVWQQNVTVTITAIDSTTGAITYTTTWS